MFTLYSCLFKRFNKFIDHPRVLLLVVVAFGVGKKNRKSEWMCLHFIAFLAEFKRTHLTKKVAFGSNARLLFASPRCGHPRWCGERLGSTTSHCKKHSASSKPRDQPSRREATGWVGGRSNVRYIRIYGTVLCNQLIIACYSNPNPVPCIQHHQCRAPKLKRSSTEQGVLGAYFLKWGRGLCPVT